MNNVSIGVGFLTAGNATSLNFEISTAPGFGNFTCVFYNGIEKQNFTTLYENPSEEFQITAEIPYIIDRTFFSEILSNKDCMYTATINGTEIDNGTILANNPTSLAIDFEVEQGIWEFNILFEYEGEEQSLSIFFKVDKPKKKDDSSTDLTTIGLAVAGGLVLVGAGAITGMAVKKK